MVDTLVSRVESIAVIEHRLQRVAVSACMREYPGEAPAFVPMRGVPDILRGFGDFAPLLAVRGRPIEQGVNRMISASEAR